MQKYLVLCFISAGFLISICIFHAGASKSKPHNPPRLLLQQKSPIPAGDIIVSTALYKRADGSFCSINTTRNMLPGFAKPALKKQSAIKNLTGDTPVCNKREVKHFRQKNKHVYLKDGKPRALKTSLLMTVQAAVGAGVGCIIGTAVEVVDQLFFTEDSSSKAAADPSAQTQAKTEADHTGFCKSCNLTTDHPIIASGAGAAGMVKALQIRANEPMVQETLAKTLNEYKAQLKAGTSIEIIKSKLEQLDQVLLREEQKAYKSSAKKRHTMGKKHNSNITMENIRKLGTNLDYKLAAKAITKNSEKHKLHAALQQRLKNPSGPVPAIIREAFNAELNSLNKAPPKTISGYIWRLPNYMTRKAIDSLKPVNSIFPAAKLVNLAAGAVGFAAAGAGVIACENGTTYIFDYFKSQEPKKTHL